MDGWRDNKTFPPKKGKRTSKNQKEKKRLVGNLYSDLHFIKK